MDEQDGMDDRPEDFKRAFRDLEDSRDLEAFRAAAEKPAGEAPADFEAAAFWRTLQSRLPDASASSQPSPATSRAVTSSAATPAAGSSWRVPTLIAAGLAVILGGTSIRQGMTIAELSQPQINVAIHDLYVDTTERSGAGAETREALSPKAGLVLLTPRDLEDFPDYRVAIFDDSGAEVWSRNGLEPDPRDGTFSFLLRPGFLDVGEYVVKLSGINGDEDQLIEEYSLLIER